MSALTPPSTLATPLSWGLLWFAVPEQCNNSFKEKRRSCKSLRKVSCRGCFCSLCPLLLLLPALEGPYTVRFSLCLSLSNSLSFLTQSPIHSLQIPMQEMPSNLGSSQMLITYPYNKTAPSYKRNNPRRNWYLEVQGDCFPYFEPSFRCQLPSMIIHGV